MLDIKRDLGIQAKRQKDGQAVGMVWQAMALNIFFPFLKLSVSVHILYVEARMGKYFLNHLLKKKLYKVKYASNMLF